MLKDAALLQLDLLLAALERDLVLKDSTPYNVQFRGARGCSSTSGRSSGCARASPGRVTASSAMLYLYPLLLQALQGCALPAVAARLPRGHHGDRDARPDVPRAIAFDAACRPTSSCTHGSSAATRHRGGEVREDLRRAGFPQGADRRQRPQAPRARAAVALGPARGRMDGVRRAQQLQRRGCCAQGGLRTRRGPGMLAAAGLGHRRQQRPLLAPRRRTLGGGRDRRRSGAARTAVPRAARRGR